MNSNINTANRTDIVNADRIHIARSTTIQCFRQFPNSKGPKTGCNLVIVIEKVLNERILLSNMIVGPLPFNCDWKITALYLIKEGLLSFPIKLCDCPVRDVYSGTGAALAIFQMNKIGSENILVKEKSVLRDTF